MSARPLIDVSGLPKHRFDTHAPIWWGNLWLLAIETTMFVIALAAYLYTQQNFQVWPPPNTSTVYGLDPVPGLTPGTINIILLVLSCVPMILTDLAARRGDRGAVKLWLTVCVALGVVMMILRWFEYGAVKFTWDSNAYGSSVWMLLVLHTLHLLTSWGEAVLLSSWVWTQPLDMHRRVDITALAVYWYWVAGIWIPFYLLLYFAPRVI
ncbi:MAG: cytochrome c oxidase subunit 3 [Acidobacteria bacterium]|nr:cytochrome c oxidase subunit 3 [Acidobacteriota bacterium]